MVNERQDGGFDVAVFPVKGDSAACWEGGHHVRHWTCKGCLLSHASHNGKTCPTCREKITGFQTHMGHFETIQVRDPREAQEDREEQQCELCPRSGDSPSDQLVLCSHDDCSAAWHRRCAKIPARFLDARCSVWCSAHKPPESMDRRTNHVVETAPRDPVTEDSLRAGSDAAEGEGDDDLHSASAEEEDDPDYEEGGSKKKRKAVSDDDSSSASDSESDSSSTSDSDDGSSSASHSDDEPDEPERSRENTLVHLPSKQTKPKRAAGRASKRSKANAESRAGGEASGAGAGAGEEESGAATVEGFEAAINQQAGGAADAGLAAGHAAAAGGDAAAAPANAGEEGAAGAPPAAAANGGVTDGGTNGSQGEAAPAPAPAPAQTAPKKIETWEETTAALLRRDPTCVESDPACCLLAPFKKFGELQYRLTRGLPEGWVLLSLNGKSMEMSAIQDVWLVVARTMTLLGPADIYFASYNRKSLALFTPKGWEALEQVTRVVRSPLRASCPLANRNF